MKLLNKLKHSLKFHLRYTILKNPTLNKTADKTKIFLCRLLRSLHLQKRLSKPQLSAIRDKILPDLQPPPHNKFRLGDVVNTPELIKTRVISEEQKERYAEDYKKLCKESGIEYHLNVGV